MSSALSAARNRRAPIGQNEPQNVPPAPYGQSYGQSLQQPSQNAGLTLPQVIALVDKRLITLEKFMKEQTELPPPVQKNTSDDISNLSAIVDEFNTRYSILAEEIDTMKNMLMKLQSFTMEVNKTLLDERIRIFSDIDTINTSLDMKRNVNFDKIENINGFPPKMDYLEQTGEFSMSNEFANYNNESK